MKNLTLPKILDWIATVTAFLLPVLIIAGVWMGFDAVYKVILTNCILLVSAILFHFLLKYTT